MSPERPDLAERIAALEVRMVAAEHTDAMRDDTLRRELLTALQTIAKEVGVAHEANQAHFASLNEWGKTFREMKDGYVERAVFEAESKALAARLTLIERERDKERGASDQRDTAREKTMRVYALVAAVVGALIGYVLKYL